MNINQLQRRDEVKFPLELIFCLEAHYRMRDIATVFIVTMDGLRVNIHEALQAFIETIKRAHT